MRRVLALDPAARCEQEGATRSEDDEIRASESIPVAEFTTGENTGWANWVNEPGQNRTWFDAGVEFRRAMEEAGYDVTSGETWLINEFDRSTARDAPRQPPDHDWPPARRADMRELMRGLYNGAQGMPEGPGIAEIGIHFRHQNIPNVNRYRLDMERWLADAAFWADADRYLRWIAVENYPDTRLWAPARVGARPRVDTWRRTSSTSSSSSEAAHAARIREELLRAEVPATRERRLARTRRRAVRVRDRAREHDLNDVQMRQFVSEQVYAIRRYAGAHGRSRSCGSARFLLAAVQSLDRTEPDCRPSDAAFRPSLDLIAARSPKRSASPTAKAIHLPLQPVAHRAPALTGVVEGFQGRGSRKHGTNSLGSSTNPRA